MKKQLLTLFAALCTAAAFSQSIPNGGFENWTTTTFEEPLYLSTSNSQNSNSNLPVSNVSKVTDSYHASFAVKLNTVLYNADTLAAFIGNGNPGSPTGQGIPYNQKPNGLKGYYKSNIVLGDTALIIVEFKLAGSLIGFYTFKFKTTQSGYTPFFIPFALPFTPDSMIFAAVSSNKLAGNFKGLPGNMLQLDSLTFTGGVTQPALWDGDFENWQPKSHDFLAGWEISSKNGGTGTNKTTDVNSGNFALELVTLANQSGGADASNATTGHGVQGGTIGGHPYSLKKDTLDFYYKYSPTDVNDSARVSLQFKAGGITFASIANLLPASATYTHVTVPFNLGSFPDSLIVFISSSKSFNTMPASFVGADLKIDDMSFRSQLVPITAFNLPATGCQNQAVLLTDNSSNIPTSYTWSATGGTLTGANTANATVTYTATGTYSVSLTTSNSYGGGGTVMHSITINQTPTVSLTVGGTICFNSGSSAHIDANNTPLSTCVWLPGNLTGNFIDVTPNVTTTYSVVATYTNGCSSSTGTISVAVLPLPNITVNSATVCAGTTTTLTANGGVSYAWTGGPNTQSLAVFNPQTTAVYTVTGSDANCSKTVTSTVTVNAIPSMTINGVTTICNGQSTTLTGTGGSIVSYSWTTGPNTASYTVSPTTASNYTLSGADANGCVNTQTVTVNVDMPPSMTFFNSSVCLGQSTATLTVGSTFGSPTYSWSPATGLNSTTGSTVLATPTVTTTYTVTGTLGACVFYGIPTVTVNPLPVPAITSNGPICFNQTLNLFSSGGVSYSWLGPNAFSSTQQNPAITNASVNATGVYTVTVTDAKGCTANDTITGVVNVCSSINKYADNTVSIYPNPSNGVFTISYADANATASVFDLTGKKVAVFNLSSAKSQIDLSNFTDGIYFIEVATQQDIFRKKITKTN